MELISPILQVIEVLLMVWLGPSVLYMLVSSIAALFYRSDVKMQTEGLPSIALFIPGYKEDEVILHVAEDALKQVYNGKFEVIIIADSFKAETIEELKALPIRLIEVSFEKSTKAKALNRAMNLIGDDYQMAVILDADNVMDQGVLNQLGSKYLEGHKAIQGHRGAKNQESKFAFIDAISEEVNNQIYCKGPAKFGFSSRLVGSGMAFDYGTFKRLMSTIDAVGGFDKELELKLIKEGITIQYLHSATIYDEKVSKAEVFGNQRTRWISAQYYYMRRSLLGAIIGLFQGKLDYFQKVYQLTFPPRLLLPGVLFFMSSMFLVFGTRLSAIVWSSIFVANVIAYSLAIPKRFWTKDLLFGMLALPKAFFIIFFAMFKLSGANKKFIHTPHSSADTSKPKTD